MTVSILHLYSACAQLQYGEVDLCFLVPCARSTASALKQGLAALESRQLPQQTLVF